MERVNVYALFLLLYALTWAALVVGVFFVAKKFKPALQMRAWFVHKRKKMFTHFPFSALLHQWLKNRYLPSVLIFLFLIILPAIALQIIMGLILISPLLAVYQGMTVGILIGDLNMRSTIWAAVTGIFELGYFAMAGALGMFISVSWLFGGIYFSHAFSLGVEIFYSGYWIYLAVCALGNALLEVAGPVYWNMHGPISLKQLAGTEESS